ncbi:peptide-methionine (R)-S-oxide reductase MsrB [Brachyspira sp. SAP_772]|uniref:peptide-methionine (R)-S-oxide reductase MsrB n=1 Tax=Brachyspira sp. SAP_772 TaxID=2608385 RepID=UPI0012F529D2|nr:peptide-methionine (R)-S-oxide reductase MsrB [Brachyspira sp. SAP_772]
MYKILLLTISIIFAACNEKEIKNIIAQQTNNTSNNNIANSDIKVAASKLTSKEYDVLINKGTEFPFTGELLDVKDDGVYTCKLCGNLLFKSDAKFNSGTGWPSFDDAIAENIKFVKDGCRVEVTCAKCGGHLGHVFYNEGFTDKQTRYCINSVSLNFVNKADFDKTNDSTTNK